MTQTDFFGAFSAWHHLKRGRRLRDEAIDALNASRSDFRDKVRSWAIQYAKTHPSVSINEIRAHFTLPEGYHVNTWSGILKCKELEPCGYTEAVHPEAHARAVRVYRLK